MADDDSKAERGEKQRTCKEWGNEREKKKKEVRALGIIPDWGDQGGSP
jgi:hypothetical protein